MQQAFDAMHWQQAFDAMHLPVVADAVTAYLIITNVLIFTQIHLTFNSALVYLNKDAWWPTFQKVVKVTTELYHIRNRNAFHCWYSQRIMKYASWW